MPAQAMKLKEIFRGLKIIRMFVFTLISFQTRWEDFTLPQFVTHVQKVQKNAVLENPADRLCTSSHLLVFVACVTFYCWTNLPPCENEINVPKCCATLPNLKQFQRGFDLIKELFQLLSDFMMSWDVSATHEFHILAQMNHKSLNRRMDWKSGSEAKLFKKKP